MVSMSGSQRRLFDAASRGDPRAVEELLEMHLPALHAFVRLQAGHAITAKESCSDLVQSVCREVLQDVSGYQYRGDAAFKSWLFKTALHKIIDRNRFYSRDKRDVAREARGPVGDAGSRLPDAEAVDLLANYGTFWTPSRDAIAREELTRIEQAFQCLEPQYREVITLCRVAGLSFAEAAEASGRSEGSIRGLLARGLARLARRLSADEA